MTELADFTLGAVQAAPVYFDREGSCEVAFDYRIVAKRLGYEQLRLEAVTIAADEESGE